MATVHAVFAHFLMFLTNHVILHLPSHALRLAWYRGLGLSVGPNSAIHLGCQILFFGPGHLRRNKVTIGANTIVNRDCVLDCRGPLTIGNNVSISAEVEILTSSHQWEQAGFLNDLQPVVIEDHAWIGTRAMVLPGTRVGRGAVISAGSVRSGDVPELGVATGVPARVIGRRPEAALEYELRDLAKPFE